MVTPIDRSAATPAPAPAPVEVSFWRATFTEPKLHEHQLAIRVLAPIEVEVYRRTRRLWDAREPNNGVSYQLEGIGSDAIAKSRIERMFRKQLEPWEAFDKAGNPIKEETLV